MVKKVTENFSVLKRKVPNSVADGFELKEDLLVDGNESGSSPTADSKVDKRDRNRKVCSEDVRNVANTSRTLLGDIFHERDETNLIYKGTTFEFQEKP